MTLYLHPMHTLPHGYSYGDIWHDNACGISGRLVTRDADGTTVRAEFDLFGPLDDLSFDERFDLAVREERKHPI